MIGLSCHDWALFVFPASNDPLSRQRAVACCRDRASSLLLTVTMVMDDHPVFRSAQFMRQAAVGKKSREIITVPADMQNWKPCHFHRIERRGVILGSFPAPAMLR